METTYYTPQEVAQILKLRVQTVYDYIRQGKLAAARFGNRWRIAPVDFDAFVAGQRASAPLYLQGLVTTGERSAAQGGREATAEPRVLADLVIFPPGTTPTERLDRAINLVEEWMADESGYDEETWPELKAALDRDHPSDRRLFPDD
jgi:excisionase family DNA binding protein